MVCGAAIIAASQVYGCSVWYLQLVSFSVHVEPKYAGGPHAGIALNLDTG